MASYDRAYYPYLMTMAMKFIVEQVINSGRCRLMKVIFGADNDNNTIPPDDLQYVNIIISKWIDYFILYEFMFAIRCLQTGNMYVKLI